MAYVLKKAKLWTHKEDKELNSLVVKYGLNSWKKIKRELLKELNIIRSTKQCRDRWLNHLKTGFSNKPFSISERNLILELMDEYGTSWANICEFLPERSENQVKNFINATVRRNIRRYNKFKPEHQKIKVNSLRLLECSEFKNVLLWDKEIKKKNFVEIKFSQDALDFAENITKGVGERSDGLGLITELDHILNDLLENSTIRDS